MELSLNRTAYNEGCTLGRLYINGELFCNTLEDKYRGQLENPADKVQNETAIPAGRYRVIVDHSAHFNKCLPHILNVPCFEGVRMHGGNRATDTEGCILCGAETNGIDTISNCASVVEILTERIKGATDEVWLTIQ